MIRIFRQYLPIHFLVLGLVEFATLILSVFAGIWLRSLGLETPSVGGASALSKALTLAVVLFLGMMAMGLYQRRFRYGTAGVVMRTATAFLGGAVVLALVYFAAPSVSLGRIEFLLTMSIALIAVSFARIVFMKFLGQEGLKRRVLVLGAGEKAAQIPRQMRRRVDQQGFTVVGYVHVRGEHDVVDEALVIRPDVTLLALARQLDVDEIVVAVGERRRKSFPVHDLLDCKLSGIDVIELQEFFERETGKIKLDLLNPSWLIFSDGFNHGRVQAAIKQAFDIVVSLMLLAVAWPFMFLTAAAIYIESGFRGPIIYRQIRVGQHWRLFHVYKFRSMRTDAEKDGAKWAVKNDDRVTKVGRFIRKVRLDELPQIFNVLKGDMSFVGPRPERPEFVTQLSEQIPYYAERHRVKPGVTGWAQVCYPYGASEKDSLEKLQYDLYYIKNYSLFLDLVIILQTAHEVTWGKGGR